MLADGDLEGTRVTTAPDGSWIIVRRGRLQVVVSIADGPVTVPLGPGAVLASWDPVERTADGWQLAGAGALVLRTQDEEGTDG